MSKFIPLYTVEARSSEAFPWQTYAQFEYATHARRFAADIMRDHYGCHARVIRGEPGTGDILYSLSPERETF